MLNLFEIHSTLAITTSECVLPCSCSVSLLFPQYLKLVFAAFAHFALFHILNHCKSLYKMHNVYDYFLKYKHTIVWFDLTWLVWLSSCMIPIRLTGKPVTHLHRWVCLFCLIAALRAGQRTSLSYTYQNVTFLTFGGDSRKIIIYELVFINPYTLHYNKDTQVIIKVRGKASQFKTEVDITVWLFLTVHFF